MAEVAKSAEAGVSVEVVVADKAVPDVPKEEKRTATLSELFSTADTLDLTLMFVGTLGAMITGGCFPFINVLFGRILDAVASDPNGFENSIKILALDFVYVSIVQIASCSLQAVCWTIAGERQAQKFRAKYVQAILRQEIGFFDMNPPSQLATKVNDSAGALEDGITRKASEIFQYLSQFLGSYAVGLYLGWKLALVLMCALPLIGGAGGFMVMAITSAQATVAENYAAAGGVASEGLGAIRTVSSLNMHAHVISRYRYYLTEAMQRGIRKGLDVGLGNGFVFCAFFLTYALGFWYGGRLVADDMEAGCNPVQDDTCITGGKVIAVFFSIVMGSFSIGQMAPALSAFTAAKAAVVPMLDVINRTPLIDGLATGESSGLAPGEPSKGAIELKSVMFCYPSRPLLRACDDYCLSIKPGQTVALVGASGSGKSTIINLLMRFYDPQQGSITLDGRDIRELNLRWLRSIYGYVSQEPVLFAGSILDNIAYGLDSALIEPGKVERNTALKEKVIKAAKLANAHDFISGFPNGYDTDVGSNGVAMSGGQKQRIAIARALIKKPAVLLLDEATSALDATSERMVQDSIDALQKMKAQTTIIIAHRLSTIRNSDKIAVVDAGSIVEEGTHDELLALDGAYAKLIKLQVEATAGAGDAPEGGADKDAAGLERDRAGSVTRSERSGSLSISPRGERAMSSATDKSLEATGSLANAADDNSKGTPEVSITAGEKADPNYVMRDKNVNSKVWKLVMKHKFWLALAMMGGAGFGALFPIIGLLLSRALNAFFQITADKVRYETELVAIWYLITAAGAVGCGILLFWGSAQLSERISLRLRSMLFEALLRREVAYFDKEENALGVLTARLSNDSRAVARASGELFAKFLQAMFTLIIGLIIGFTASWKLSLIVLATFPINVVAGTIQQQEQMGIGQKTSKDFDSNHANSLIATAFTNMRTVSAFSMHFKVIEEYTSSTLRMSLGRRHVMGWAGVYFGISNGITFSTYAFLFYIGSTLIKSNEIDFEQMMRALFCIMFGAMGMGAALADVGDQKLGLQAADRIFDAIKAAEDSPIDGLSKAGDVLTTRSKGGIELRDVHFRYPTRPDVEVCRGFSLTIAPGEVVAFVGPSGSGKSTIMNLLLRFYDVESGTILLDGMDIRSINIQSLRSQIGYVGQEPVLFKMSVGDNIAKGRAEMDCDLAPIEVAISASDIKAGAGACCQPSASSTAAAAAAAAAAAQANKPKQVDPGSGSYAVVAGDVELGAMVQAAEEAVAVTAPDIIQAAKLANAHEFISGFSALYDTDVGEQSALVSGGQKQRIAIARALIKKPAVLLLDEATSALDATSERMVQDSIDALQKMKAQTTIIIAHRLSTIKGADRIFVVDKGSIVQSGTHDALLATGGLYASLWAMQGGGGASHD